MIQRINIYVYPPLFKQASADLSAKQFSKAQLQFKKCLQVNPSSYSSYLNLAYIAHIKKDYKKAETLCDIAINIRPYCGEAYYNRCLAMIAQGISKFQFAIRDINSAYSCYYLENFKCSGQLEALQEAVKYSQNNFQALRLLVTLSKTNKKQYYKNLLHQHEEWYRVSGSINANKSIASAPEQGLYRLNGKTQNLTIQTIKRKISQYNLLIKSRKSQQATKQKQKNRLQSGIYQLTIQPQTNIIKQFSQNSQSQRQSQQYNINVLSSFDCDSVQLKRYSTNIQDSSRQTSSYHLNIPLSNENLNRYSLAQITRSPMVLSRVSNANRMTDNSFKQNHNKLQNSFRRVNGSMKCDNSMTSSRFCLHHGCTKCTKQNKDIPSGPPNGIKMQIKTLQIFRNQNIVNPKPYIIVYDGQKSHITEVDQQGGHFPSWNRVFYLRKDSEQPYRIELWHKGYKQKQDFLIGTATFQNKQGRFKSYFIKKHGGVRKTGYIFIQMGK